MKKLQFKEGNTQKVYNDYMKRIERAAKVLSKEDKTELMLEFNSHIFEGLQASKEGSEMDNLLPILERLGAPEEVLAPAVAEKKLQEATRTFNPKHVLQALILNIRNGLVFSVFGILYLFLFAFFVMIGAKLFKPEHTGLFMEDGEMFLLGIVDNPAGLEEVLGYWLIPILLCVMALIYVLITWLLRLWSRL